jgi:long-subunit fatty acid transport protein
LFVFRLNAQTIDDILKVSYQNYEGTARFAAMGGAFGALGGDVSSVGVNPAGLAVFRRPHISVTSSLNHVYNNSDFAGVSAKSSRPYAGISSVGAVITMENENKINWIFGISYLKKANFNRRTVTGYFLDEKSIIDYFSDKANEDTDFFVPNYLNSHNAFYDYDPVDWDVVMAYGTHLIDWDGDKYTEALYSGDRVYQHINSTLGGSSGEMTMNLGVRFDDKFYAGLLFGMTTLNYRRQVTYREYAHKNNISAFDMLDYNTNLRISGTGFNYKIGVIYKPVHAVRLGLAFHSPDRFFHPYRNTEYEDSPNIMDNLYSASMDVRYITDDLPLHDGPNEDFYLFFDKVKTPYKAIGSIACVFGKFGLVSMDCEYANYSRIRIGGSYPSELFNSDIEDYFKSTINLRFGTEFWVRNFALRAGYMHNQSPDKDYDLSSRSCSVGLGYKFGQFNIDMSYVRTDATDYYSHYSDANRITENLKSRRFSLTFGWTFDYDFL